MINVPRFVLFCPMTQNRPVSIIADIVVMAFVCILPHAASMPMIVYVPIILLVLWGYLHSRGMSFANIGFRWKDISWRSFVIGVLLGIGWAALVYLMVGPLILKTTGLPRADLSDFDGIRHRWNEFIMLLIIAWVLVIPYEEIIFRGFIFTTLRRLLGDTSILPGKVTARFWLAGLLHSIIFSFYHWQEGGSAMITIFAGAMLSVGLYKLFRGNLWYLIFFHAAYDTVMLSLFRYGYM